MNDNSCAHLRVFRWILAGLGLAVLALYFLERAAKLSGNAVWLLAAAVLAIAFSALYRWVLRPMQSCRNDRLEREYAADILNKQAELDALQSQINPHFLYNTLDSIRGQALSEGAEDIADMTEALSTFFRYSISNRNNIVTLEEELENVRNYFMIQQFRFNNRFRLQILPVPQELLNNCRLPKLTLQPILENTILHGMEEKLGPGTINIRVLPTDARTVITISDDGAGMSEETLLHLQEKLRGDAPVPLKRSKGSGIALTNVNRRIKLLFGSDYGLRIMSTLGLGTDVEISLPRSGGADDAA